MPKFNNMPENFLAQLADKKQTSDYLSTYPLIIIPCEIWGESLKAANASKHRFVAIWAEEHEDKILVTICFESLGNYKLLRTFLSKENPIIASATNTFPQADRLERHMRDLLGIEFTDHPDKRRWTRHAAWQKNEFPLRNDFPLTGKKNTEVTSPDCDYPFAKFTGSGVYEIPVGPVHAGIIEPGHFRFHAAGEDIINLEERLGYVHKGIEKIAEGRDVHKLLRLAARISGDSTVAFSWATACACEMAAKIEISEHSAFLRAILSERERIINHLWDVAAVCNDVGFSFAYFQLGRLRELCLRTNLQVFGHRLMMDCITAGGVNFNLDNIKIKLLVDEIKNLQNELTEIYPILEQNSTLHDRLKNTGVLSPDKASKCGALGFVGKASGIKFDMRINAPYAPYDKFKINIPSFQTGDVLARVRVRSQEILVSLNLLLELLQNLPNEEQAQAWSNPQNNSEGIGLIEGWRGETFVYVRFSADGRVARFFPRDPSWFAWPALEQLIHGNIVPDFPVCNKSINGSYSGVDL